MSVCAHVFWIFLVFFFGHFCTQQLKFPPHVTLKSPPRTPHRWSQRNATLDVSSTEFFCLDLCDDLRVMAWRFVQGGAERDGNFPCWVCWNGCRRRSWEIANWSFWKSKLVAFCFVGIWYCRLGDVHLKTPFITFITSFLKHQVLLSLCVYLHIYKKNSQDGEPVYTNKDLDTLSGAFYSMCLVSFKSNLDLFPTSFFQVTFWSPKWRSLNPWKVHLKHPKRSLGRTW